MQYRILDASNRKEDSLLQCIKHPIYEPSPSTFSTNKVALLSLTLEGEAGAELVAGFVQLLGIKGTANTKGEAAVDLGVVGKGRDAEVVDLGLYKTLD